MLQAGGNSCPPAALAGDNLEVIVLEGAYQQRHEYALAVDAASKFLVVVLVEPFAALALRVERRRHQLRCLDLPKSLVVEERLDAHVLMRTRGLPHDIASFFKGSSAVRPQTLGAVVRGRLSLPAL